MSAREQLESFGDTIETPEGTCVRNFGGNPDLPWYNETTAEYGDVRDGEFVAALFQ